jgi:16S rRNA pseudouridine516 synthase
VKRLDQWLSNLGYCSRREARAWLRDGRLTRPHGEAWEDVGARADAAEVRVDGEPLDHPEGLLVMMNKPAGVVCSHDTREGRRVYDLVPERWNRRIPPLASIGRLDRDTTGLLLLTDQTALVHQLTSPKHKVPKRYVAGFAQPVPVARQEEIAALFASGSVTLEGETEACLPAELHWRGPAEAEIVLVEGRFHQVKRMFAAVGAVVITLHRSNFGRLALPDDLPPSEFRLLAVDFSFF